MSEPFHTNRNCCQVDSQSTPEGQPTMCPKCGFAMDIIYECCNCQYECEAPLQQSVSTLPPNNVGTAGGIHSALPQSAPSVDAMQSALEVIAALKIGTTWELSVEIGDALDKAHDKLIVALRAASPGKLQC